MGTGATMVVLLVAAAVFAKGEAAAADWVSVDPKALLVCLMVAENAYLPDSNAQCCEALSHDESNWLQCELQDRLARRRRPMAEIFPCIREEATCQLSWGAVEKRELAAQSPATSPVPGPTGPGHVASPGPGPAAGPGPSPMEDPSPAAGPVPGPMAGPVPAASPSPSPAKGPGPGPAEGPGTATGLGLSPAAGLGPTAGPHHAADAP
ncbi:hypothetical protein VPH35_127142 [Triticum aestivum]